MGFCALSVRTRGHLAGLGLLARARASRTRMQTCVIAPDHSADELFFGLGNALNDDLELAADLAVDGVDTTGRVFDRIGLQAAPDLLDRVWQRLENPLPVPA